MKFSFHNLIIFMVSIFIIVVDEATTKRAKISEDRSWTSIVRGDNNASRSLNSRANQNYCQPGHRIISIGKSGVLSVDQVTGSNNNLEREVMNPHPAGKDNGFPSNSGSRSVRNPLANISNGKYAIVDHIL